MNKITHKLLNVIEMLPTGGFGIRKYRPYVEMFEDVFEIPFWPIILVSMTIGAVYGVFFALLLICAFADDSVCQVFRL